jgi:SPW repeat-containing protein
MTRPAGLERHPDIMELRAKYERAASSTTAQAVDGLTLLAGLFLAISPWVVGFNGLSRLAVSNLVTGIALAALAIGFASAYGRTHGLSWIAPIIGVWTIVSPWVARSSTTSSIWTNVVTGIVILLLGLCAVAVGMRRPGMMHSGS